MSKHTDWMDRYKDYQKIIWRVFLMKTRNKLIGALTLILCMFFLTSNGVSASEYKKPVFLSADFAKDTFESGEPVTVNIYTESGESEIDSIFARIEHEETGREFYNLKSADSQSETKVEINLPSEAPPGKYVLNAGTLTDSAGVNSFTHNIGISFELIGAPTDIEKPIFHNAFFDKEQYGPGDEVILRMDATDEHSGIDYIFATIQHTESEQYRFFGYSTEVDGYQEIRFQLPETALDGDYGVRHLYIDDNSGNRLYVFDVDATFHVEGGSTDNEAPILKDIWVEKSQYKQGEQVHIDIEAADESGVKSIYVDVRHKETNVAYGARAIFNGKTFEYNRDLPMNAPLGEYEVLALHLEDNLGNKEILLDYGSKIEFKVIE